MPEKCRVAVACTGVDVTDQTVANPGTTDTARCGAGYTGTICGTCAESYYAVDLICLPCGSDSSAVAELVLALIITVCCYFLISLMVAFATTKTLASFIGAWMALQSLIVVAKSAVQENGNNIGWLVTAINYASLANFDIQFYKPGKVIALGHTAHTLLNRCQISAHRCVTRRWWGP